MRGFLVAALCVGSLMAGSVTAEARGCLKGAIIGGIAGHFAGHGLAGAAAGCAIGSATSHYRADRRYRTGVPVNRPVRVPQTY